MWPLLLFVSVLSLLCSCSTMVSAPGDIIIGGLLPIHLGTNKTKEPWPGPCYNYDFQMFLRAQVMIFAIQEINQRTPNVLPNVTIGYEIYDTCGDVTNAINHTLRLLYGRPDNTSYCEPYDLSNPRVKIVIGERTSEVSIAVSRLLALSSVPQIGYASTSELLSRKYKFPSFLRTISSDAYQTMAIAELVKQFNWEIVGIVGSDDEYGKYGSERLIDHFNDMKNVCIDFKKILPDDFILNKHKPNVTKKLMELIKKSTAEAIILFTKEANVHIILEEALRLNLNRTWIASDTWSTSRWISEKPEMLKLGQVFGFVSKRNEVPGFKEFLEEMIKENTSILLKKHLSYYPPCLTPKSSDLTENCSKAQPDQSRCMDPNCLVRYIDQDESYNIYLAVKVIAEALRNLLGCDNKMCTRDPRKFTALELLEEIKKVNTSVDNITHIFFDQNGDPNIGYDIVEWDMTGNSIHVKRIGEYWPSGKIELQDDLLCKMTNVTVTAFNCEKTCAPGYELKSDAEQCCKKCVPCTERHVSPGGGMECTPCGEYQYRSKEMDKCLDLPTEFLEWSDSFVVVLTFFEILGIIGTILVTVLFAVHRETPIVKAVGGWLCFLELLSLLACFCSTFAFMGKPTPLSCQAGLPVFGMAYTLCISCIMANLIQILVGFNFDQREGSRLKKLNKPVAVVVIFSVPQVALCVLWLTYHPPSPKRDTIHSIHSFILEQCSNGSNGSNTFLICMLGYIALLALVCFLLAFKGKRLPDLYKNASFITMSMSLFLVVWILFIPIYIYVNNKYLRAIEAAAILVSSYSILGCRFIPKCYIIKFRKELNDETAIVNYIRKHYELKGMSMMKS